MRSVQFFIVAFGFLPSRDDEIARSTRTGFRASDFCHWTILELAGFPVFEFPD
jgi:hypothetical protein